MDLVELGGEIHSKRIEVGLLQEHVAKFAGLSRVTVNQLENGALKDLGYTKLKAVMDILGIGLEPVQRSGLKNALAVAARSVSTSYRDELSPGVLASMLRSGEAPVQFQPHLMPFLDEVPPVS